MHCIRFIAIWTLLLLSLVPNNSWATKEQTPPSRLGGFFKKCVDLIRPEPLSQAIVAPIAYRLPSPLEFVPQLGTKYVDEIVKNEHPFHPPVLLATDYEFLVPPQRAQEVPFIVKRLHAVPHLETTDALVVEHLRDYGVAITIPNGLSGVNFEDVQHISQPFMEMPAPSRVEASVPLVYAPNPAMPGEHLDYLDYQGILNGLFTNVSQKLRVALMGIARDFLDKNGTAILLNIHARALRTGLSRMTQPVLSPGQLELFLTLIANEARNENVKSLAHLSRIILKYTQTHSVAAREFLESVASSADLFRYDPELARPNLYPAHARIDLIMPSGGRIAVTMKLQLWGLIDPKSTEIQTQEVYYNHKVYHSDILPKVEFTVKAYPSAMNEVPTQNEISAVAELLRQATERSFSELKAKQRI